MNIFYNIEYCAGIDNNDNLSSCLWGCILLNTNALY